MNMVMARMPVSVMQIRFCVVSFICVLSVLGFVGGLFIFYFFVDLDRVHFLLRRSNMQQHQASNHPVNVSHSDTGTN